MKRLCAAFACVLYLGLPGHLTAQVGPGIITTFAGGEIEDGGPAIQARLNRPADVAVDAKGNLYIADTENGRIRRVRPDGTITAFAGGGTGGLGDGGPAFQAQLGKPTAIAVDAKGNVYIADTNNHRIRQVEGIETTEASGPSIRLSTTLLRFDSTKVDETPQKTFVISNTGNGSLSVTGITVSGTDAGQFGVSPVTATIPAGGSQAVTVMFAPNSTGAKSATLSIAHNAAGSPPLAVTLRGTGVGTSAALESPGVITTFAGTGTGGFSGDSGLSTQASLNKPYGVAVDSNGNVYIADYINHRIRRVGSEGIITTFAGTGLTGLGKGGFSGDGGPATQAQLNEPLGVAVDAKGVVYIADTFNNRIRRVGPEGIITTFAGTGIPGFSGDGGPGAQATLSTPSGVAVDTKGAVYIADSGNGCIRRVGPDGIITTFAGGGGGGPWVPVGESPGRSPSGIGDGGPAAQARLMRPSGVAVDAKGVVYIADSGNDRIRRVGPSGIITTFAGGGGRGLGGGSGLATEFDLDSPTGVAVDAKGGVYIADSDRFQISRVGPDGIIRLFAGSSGQGIGGDGGPAVQANLYRPTGVAVDVKGTLYIADPETHRIRQVADGPSIGLEASPLRFDTTNVGAAASQKTFRIWNFGNRSLSIAEITVGGMDASQFKVSPTTTTIAVGQRQTVTVTFTPTSVGAKSATLSIAHNAIGKPTLTIALSGTGVGTPLAQGAPGVITTFAGGGTGGDGGPAVQARLNNLSGVAVDAQGNLYIADSDNNRIRRVEATEVEVLLLSSLICDNTKVGSTSQRMLVISNPGSKSLSITGITMGETDAVQFKVSPTAVTVAAGQSQIITVTFSPTSTGTKSASLSVAHNAPGSLSTVTVSGTGFVGGPGEITTFAGSGPIGEDEGDFSGDGGPAVQARLGPSGMAMDAQGNVYIADTDNGRIRRVGPDGIITTLAGTGAYGFSGDGGSAIQASLDTPLGVAVDAKGNLYIADRNNYRIRRVGTEGIITTFAGTGTQGFSGDRGPATQANLNNSLGVAVDAKGNVYIADTDNGRIRRVGPDGIITTLAGTGTYGFSGDGGTAVQAQLYRPNGITVDAKGNLYIADEGNHRIRRVGPDGIITTFAGTGREGFSGDGGPATQAQLFVPSGVAVDTKENVYIADSNNHRIRRVGPDGIITTFAGGGTLPPGSIGDGGPAIQARLSYPAGVAVDAKGNLYIADRGNYRIRRVEGGSLTGVSSLASDFDGNGEVGFNDFFQFASAFGQKATGANAKFDLDKNGEVDFNDFFAFAAEFGKTIRSGKATASIPGVNDHAALSVETVTNLDGLTARIAASGVAQLRGFTLAVSYDPAALTFVRAERATDALLSRGGPTPLFLTREMEPGRVILADAIAGDGTASGDGPMANLLFRRIGPDGAATVIVDLAQVFDGAGGVNVLSTMSHLIPSAYALTQNYPNPFNPQTQIAYSLPEAGRVRLIIYNLLGQTVRTLVDETQAAGRHSVRWDGRDDEGRRLASGVYLYRLKANGFSAVRRMVMVK